MLVTVANKFPDTALQILIFKKKVFTAAVTRNLKKVIFVSPPLNIFLCTPLYQANTIKSVKVSASTLNAL